MQLFSLKHELQIRRPIPSVQFNAGDLYYFTMLRFGNKDVVKCDILKNLCESIVFSCFSGNNAHHDVPEKPRATRETLLIDHGLR
jgi:hypothetical protein